MLVNTGPGLLQMWAIFKHVHIRSREDTLPVEQGGVVQCLPVEQGGPTKRSGENLATNKPLIYGGDGATCGLHLEQRWVTCGARWRRWGYLWSRVEEMGLPVEQLKRTHH